MEFINSAYVFSLYPNLVTVDSPLYNIDINQLYETIKYGYIRDIIESLRKATNKVEVDLIKRYEIPCVTVSGIFDHRENKSLVHHNGLMQIDIDNVEDYATLFQKLIKDNFIYVCFRSPRGQGIKAIVKIKPSAETHKAQFNALEIYFKEKYAIEIDPHCKDISRSMLLSYDPDIFCNPHSLIFEKEYTPIKYSKPIYSEPAIITESKPYYADNPEEVIERIITSLERSHIDITNSYANWIKVGFALCTTFGEQGRGYFHRIGRMYPHYTREETDRTYTQLLAKNNDKTRMGSIIYLAREAGVTINKH